jgi:hypothetical protein
VSSGRRINTPYHMRVPHRCTPLTLFIEGTRRWAGEQKLASLPSCSLLQRTTDPLGMEMLIQKTPGDGIGISKVALQNRL